MDVGLFWVFHRMNRYLPTDIFTPIFSPCIYTKQFSKEIKGKLMKKEKEANDNAMNESSKKEGSNIG